MMTNQEINWLALSEAAWNCRENASIIGKTKVGAALLSVGGNIYEGCNVEQVYRNHDVHAEVNAISHMISKGEKRFNAIIIVADRENFTPCGSCLDWIFQFGGPETIIAFQRLRNGGITIYKAKELMPHYPH
jgi:cytidine deaminase